MDPYFNISIGDVYIKNVTLNPSVSTDFIEVKVIGKGWQNDTWQPMTGSGNWSNVTKVINDEIGKTIYWKVYANDTGDLWNTSKTYSFVTTNTPPQWSNNISSPDPANYLPDQFYEFNVTWDDHHGVSTVKIEHNFTGSSDPHNDTVTTYETMSGNKREYYFNVTDLPAGTYVWKEYANDTHDSWNVTNDGNYWTYTVNKVSTTMNLYLNKTDGDFDCHTNDTVNMTADLADLDQPFDVEIWTNFTGTYEKWVNGSEPLINYTSMDYGLGQFNVTGNFSGNQNYTASYDSHILTVWGWSNVSWISPDDGDYLIGDVITLNCSVLDANLSTPIQNYLVNFYNETATASSFIGTNKTDSSGYAIHQWNATGLSEGIYYPKCNITNNATLYYNVSVPAANTTINLTQNEPPNIWNLVVRDTSDVPRTSTNPGVDIRITVNISDPDDNIDYVEANFTWPNGTMVYHNLTNITGKPYTHNWTYALPVNMPNGTALINVTVYDTKGATNSTNTTLTINMYAELDLDNYPINFSIAIPGRNVSAVSNYGWPLLAQVQGNWPLNLTQNATEYLTGLSDPTVKIYIRNITWNTTESGKFTTISTTEMVVNASTQPGYDQPIYYRLYVPVVKNQSYGGMVYIHGSYV